MQFICESCKANLQIADEKVRGKRLIVRCKRCGTQIRIADPALAAAQSGARPSTGPIAASQPARHARTDSVSDENTSAGASAGWLTRMASPQRICRLAIRFESGATSKRSMHSRIGCHAGCPSQSARESSPKPGTTSAIWAILYAMRWTRLTSSAACSMAAMVMRPLGAICPT